MPLGVLSWGVRVAMTGVTAPMRLITSKLTKRLMMAERKMDISDPFYRFHYAQYINQPTR
jgi:hypothetical protein